MNAFLNSYSDAQGKRAGTLLSLSPGLHLVLELDGDDPLEHHTIGIACPKCGQIIQGRNIFPVPEDTRVLGCDCLTVLFRAPAFPLDWVVERWDQWRSIKAQAVAQLAIGAN
jgi:hypothetical protein